MDQGEFRQIKRLMTFARKLGAKRFACQGFEIEFQEGLMPSTRERVSRVAKELDAKAAKDAVTRPAPPPGPTLEEINKFIYDESNEQH